MQSKEKPKQTIGLTHLFSIKCNVPFSLLKGFRPDSAAVRVVGVARLFALNVVVIIFCIYFISLFNVDTTTKAEGRLTFRSKDQNLSLAVTEQSRLSTARLRCKQHCKITHIFSPPLLSVRVRLYYVPCQDNPSRWMSLSPCASPHWTRAWTEWPCLPARSVYAHTLLSTIMQSGWCLQLKSCLMHH